MLLIPNSGDCSAISDRFAPSGGEQKPFKIFDNAEDGITATESPGRGQGARAVLCLPLDLLPGWLFGMTTTRVKPALQEKIIHYRTCEGAALVAGADHGE